MQPLPDNLISPPIRPVTDAVLDLAPGTPFRDAFLLLSQGRGVCLTGTYGAAMAFYSRLKKEIAANHPIHDYASSRRHQDAWHAVNAQVLIRISDHRPALERAPHNPWLKDFFPDVQQFLMAFATFLGLNGARQWYEKGIRYPVLPHRIHPFYGTYFPTRHDHLLLFDRWLKSTGTEVYRRGIDIGTGCGVLAFIMHAHGLPHIQATDINPNAIYSLQEDLKRLGPLAERSIFPEQADLLGSFQPQSRDLIVFNPPWIPAEPETPMDEACYYRPNFFEDFFCRMARQCPTGTTLVLLFSNFAKVAGLLTEHPVLHALEEHHALFKLADLSREPVRQASKKGTAWLSEIRRQEQVEVLVIQRR